MIEAVLEVTLGVGTFIVLAHVTALSLMLLALALLACLWRLWFPGGEFPVVEAVASILKKRLPLELWLIMRARFAQKWWQPVLLRHLTLVLLRKG